MKKLTITIGIPAHNEEANIAPLLTAILQQEFDPNIHLSEVIVVSDGSTDMTVARAKKIKDTRIKVLVHEEQAGKNARINELLSLFRSDVLVLLDCDVKLDNDRVINNLVKKFRDNDKLGLIAGNAQPLPAETLIEAGINNFVGSLNGMKRKIKNGNNVYSVRGPILALGRCFAKVLSLPSNAPDDRYTYFACRRMGYGFQFTENALVWYRSPQTADDQFRQGERFKNDKENLYAHFQASFIDREYFVPVWLKIQMLLYQLVKNPLAYLTLKYLHLRILLKRSTYQGAAWTRVASTKGAMYS